MTLQDLALAAILSLARAPAVDVATEEPRLRELASAIAEAVTERDEIASWLDTVEPLPFRGSASREATVLALVAIAAGESAFRADVSDCRKTGDVGRSVSSFQLMSGWAWGGARRDAICASPQLAARLALRVLAHHGGRGPNARAFLGYASGHPGRVTIAGRKHCARWIALCARFGIAAPCDGSSLDFVRGPLNRTHTAEAAPAVLHGYGS